MKLSLLHDYSLETGILGLAVAREANRAVVTCVNGSVHEVELGTGQTSLLDGKHLSFASGCVLLPDGKTAISGGYDGQLLWHDLKTGRCWRRVQAHEFWNWQLALSPDGQRIATTTGQYLAGGWKYEPALSVEPTVKIFDSQTGNLVAAFPLTPPVLSCAFSPDGKYLAAANMMGEVRVWSLLQKNDEALIAEWKSADFTSWGTTKTHHYCGGIYGLAFSPNGDSLVGCGMGSMTDPMAGNGKMTWQRWNWRKGERTHQIKDGQHGSGLMETVAWHPKGEYFVMAGRQAQGTWNAAVFSESDGELIHSLDTKKRITHAHFSSDGNSLVIAGASGQPQRKQGVWAPWGKLQMYRIES